MLDKVVEELTDAAPEEELLLPRFAIVGRPNVGKSSLVNALLGEERNIVTPISGTTRDTILSRYNKYNHDFYLVDTAGLRKKGKPIPTNDIWIASVAFQHGFPLVTKDRHFEHISGLILIN